MRGNGVPGDDQKGMIPATRFLKEVNLGEQPPLPGDVRSTVDFSVSSSAMASPSATVSPSLLNQAVTEPSAIELPRSSW